MKKQISKLPPGHLISSKNSNRYKWYQSDGHSKNYIPNKNQKLVEELAVKKYLSCRLEELQIEEQAANAYLEKCKDMENIQKSDELIHKDSRYYQFLNQYFTPLSEELVQWANAPYDKSNYKLENLKCKSAQGNMFRSKSEAIIEGLLYTHKIPYRYECALDLSGHIVYPDFTIRHPKTGQIYYWEHCGKMDDIDYVKRFCRKLEEYAKNGIVPSINLILTYETAESQFDIELAEKIIQYYFE